MASVTTPAVPPRTKTSRPQQSHDGNGVGVIQTSDAVISQRIAMAQAALWRAELSRSLLIPVVACLLGLTVWAAVDQWIWSPGKSMRFVFLLSGISAIVIWTKKRVWPLMSQQIRADYAAHSLENDLPELRHSLTSYVSLSRDHTREGVRGVVVRSIGVRAADQLQHHDLEVPSEASVNLKWWIGVAGAIALALGFAALSPKDSVQSTKRLLLPLASIDAPSRVRISDVLPGDIEVLAGRPFEISADIVGLSETEQARIEFSTGFATTKPLDLELGKRYVGAITVDSATSYRIVAGDATAGPFAITTKDVPVVSIDRVEVTPPAYTGLAIRSTSGGAVVGEESSIARIMAKTNRPISRARVEFNPRQVGEKLQATGGTLDMKIAGDGMTLEAVFPLRRSLRNSANATSVVALESYLLHVWDSSEAENLEPIIYPVRIIADLEPEVTITEPQKQLTEVPINGAQRIEIHALDPDYGLKLIELKLSRGVDLLKTEVLWSSVEGERGNQSCVWIFQPKSLGLSVGQTIQMVAIAADNRHDENGKLASNSVSSDPISIKVSEPEANSKLPNFEQPKNQPETQSDQAGPSEADGQTDGKSQEGQGGSSGKGQSGKSQKGDGKSQGGSAGSGQKEQGDEEGQEQQASGSGKSGENKSGKNQSQDSEKKSGNGAGGKSTEDGDENSSGEQSTDPSDSPAGGSSGHQSGEGQHGKKPEHDGDAFERIRDFIDESKKQDNGDEKSIPKDDSADQSGGSANASEGGAGMKPDSSKGEQGDSKSPSKAANKDNADNNDEAGSNSETSPGKPNQDSTDKNSQDPASSGRPGNKKSGDGKAEKANNDAAAGEAGSDEADSGEKGKRDAANDKAANDNAANDNAGSDNAVSDKPGSDKAGSNELGKGKTGKGDSGANEAAESSSEPPRGDAKGKDSPRNQSAEKEKPNDDQGNGAKGETGGNSGKPSGADSPSDDVEDSRDSTKDGDAASEPADEGKSQDGRGAEKKETGKTGKDSGKKGQPSPGAKDKQPAEAGDGESKPSGAGKNGAPKSNSQSSQSAEPSSSVSPGGNSEQGDGSATESPDVPQVPDPVDVEQAKQATDLVLKYLNSQREKPDPELLERLDWTPEELRAFTDRWNKIRRSDQAADGDGKEIEEALRSLGIRAVQNGQMGQTTETDDAVRGLKDSGNRTPAPSIHRDAFDAFRKNIDRR